MLLIELIKNEKNVKPRNSRKIVKIYSKFVDPVKSPYPTVVSVCIVKYNATVYNSNIGNS